MLAFISDLHLTDGSTCETISPDAFSLFVEDLQWMVAQACRRRDRDGSESFAPVERVDLILLGDILDVLRSDSWHSDSGLGEVRPWTPEMSSPEQRGAAHERLAARVTQITRAILERNCGRVVGGPTPDRGRGIEALRELVEHGIALDPSSVPDGYALDPGHRIPVEIWYLPGNHDWFYNVANPAYDPARQLLVDAFGLAHPADRPFPHTLDEAPAELRELFAAHKVFAQHGDLYDPENIQVDLEVAEPGLGRSKRAYSSIGDMIVIELLNGLPGQIQRELRAIDDPLADNQDFMRSLEELDNVRPMLAVPQWLAGVLQRHETGAVQHRALEEHRRNAVSAAIRARLEVLTEDPFAKRLDKFLRWDLVDTLEAGKVLSDWLSVDALAKVSYLGEKGSRPKSYREHAVVELAKIQGQARERQAEIIVFGHTHHPEVVALDLDGPRGWVYINTGTWRRVHERCVAESGRLEFISFHVMSFAAVYKGNERSGRPYETWTGTLGSRPPG